MQLTKVRHNKRTLEATLEHVARSRSVTIGVRHSVVVFWGRGVLRLRCVTSTDGLYPNILWVVMT